MSTDQPQQPEAQKKLTLDDPLDADTLGKFKQLQTVRLQVSERLLDLEQEKVRILRMAANVDQERTKLFETVLSPRAPSELPGRDDANTGKINPIPEAVQAGSRSQGRGSARERRGEALILYESAWTRVLMADVGNETGNPDLREIASLAGTLSTFMPVLAGSSTFDGMTPRSSF